MNAKDQSRLVALAESLADDHADMMASLLAIRRDGLTQADVAERMGVTQPTVAALERYDANPTLLSVRRYALAVGAEIQTRVSRVDVAPTGVQPHFHIWGTLKVSQEDRPHVNADGVGWARVVTIETTTQIATVDPREIWPSVEVPVSIPHPVEALA